MECQTIIFLHFQNFNSSIKCQKIIKEKRKNQKGKVNVMGEAAMMNAYFICHNVQVKYTTVHCKAHY